MAFIKIVSYNVNGLVGDISQNPRNCAKWQMILDETKEYDIIALQEIHKPSDVIIKKINKAYSGKTFWNPGSQNSGGTLFLVKDTSFSIVDCTIKSFGTIQELCIEYGSNRFIIWNVYASHLDGLKVWAEKFLNVWEPAENMILLGDWNGVENVQLDRKSKIASANESNTKAIFEKLRFESFKDTWRERYPTEIQFSFYGSLNRRSRIDRIYTGNEVEKHILSVKYENKTLTSDHSMLSVKIQKPDIVRWGRSFWKCNNSHLGKEDLNMRLENFWSYWRTRKQLGEGLLEWWDLGKSHIRRIITLFSKEQAKQTGKTRERELQERLEGLQTEQNQGIIDNNVEISAIQNSLREIASKRVKGQYVRSRMAEIRDEKGSTEWYKRFEDRSGKSKSITVLLDENGVESMDKDVIMQTVRNFYVNLYSKETQNIDMQESLLNSIDRCLSDTEKECCEGFISETEAHNAVKSMKNNKSPGHDGLGKEFYTKYWYLVGSDLTEVINAVWFAGKLTNTMKEAVISLLFKKSDPKLLKNWRPISLLTCDYKIISRVLAARLRKVLPGLVFVTQSCGVANRSMTDNLVMLRLLQEYIQYKQEGVVLFGYDFEKAFDRVDQLWMQKVLKKMNFGPIFLRWISSIYNDVSAKVQVNGLFTKSFNVSRGIRQGCPVSMLLFVLQAEPFLEAIRQNPKITGYRLPFYSGMGQLKCLSYADDNLFILSNPLDRLELEKEITRYSQASGAKINQDKTEALILGKVSEAYRNTLPLQYLKSEIKVLGVLVGHNQHNRNWQVATEAIGKRINKCYKKSLTWFDRVKFVNTYILPKVYHIIPFEPPNNVDIKNIESKISKFLWDYPIWRPISTDTLSRKWQDGGLRLPRLKFRSQTFCVKLIELLFKGSGNNYRRVWWAQLVFWLGLNIPNIRQLCSKVTENQYLHVPLANCNKSKYAKSLLNAFKATSGIFPPVNWAMFDTRKVYWSLLYSGIKTSKCFDKEPFVDWDRIWPEILSMELPSRERLISYQIINFALPFECFLSSALDNRCMACGDFGKDNPKHFFSECSKFTDLRHRMNTAVKGLNLSLNWNWDTIRFNGALGPHIVGREQKMLRTICAVYKSVLWLERLSAIRQTHRRYMPNSESLDNIISRKCRIIMSLR